MGIGINRDEGVIGVTDTAFTLNSSDWRGLNRNQTQTAIIHNVYGGFGEETPRIFTEYSPTIRTPQGGGHLPMVISFQTRSPDRPSLKYSSGGSGTLTRNDGNTFCLDGACGQGILSKQSIRRLTPRECERLQGFPDDWTKYGLGGELISDTQRYKMCGNAVTVSVVQEIARKFEDGN
jgi:DNA (cytosine-5)-methyltransferase 1